MPAPAASIIIATYNRSAALRRALAGVLAQTYTDFEVLVVGDACTDDSEAVVRAAADDRVYWLNRAENSGSQALPHNDGLARSRGRYIAYCDHDDIWFPWHLGGLVARLEETGADFVQDYLAWLDGDAVRGVTGPPPDGNYAAYSVTPSVWLVRRALLEAIGDWPEPGGLDDSHVKVVLRRFAQAGASFAAVSRLGALVFPSHLAPVYATPGAAQQDLWAGRVATDPDGTERAVLWELARLQAGRPPARPSLRAALRWRWRAALRGLMQWYGHERWPLHGLRVRRWQRCRRLRRAARGLPE